MKAIFIGCVESSVVFLRSLLLTTEVEIVGIVSKSKSDYNSDFVSLIPIAEENNIDSLDYSKSKKSLAPWIAEKKVDIVYCLGWSHLLEGEVLDTPTFGVIGYHPTELPKNRGRHPIIWTLALGLKETASTFFLMDAGADSGKILSQKRCEVLQNDDASSLYRRLVDIGSKQLVDLTHRVVSGTIEPVEQDHSKANYWRKRSKLDGQIDWRMSAINIYNLIRALSLPYCGAHFKHGDEDVIVWKSEVVLCADENVEPGKVIILDRDGFVIKCGSSAIRLTKIEKEITISVGDYL